MRTKHLLLPLAIAAASATSPAFADFTGGDFIVRAGAAFMDTEDSVFSESAIVDVLDPDDPDSTISVEVGDSLDLDDDTTWFINGTFFVADHWAVELYYMDGADLEADYDTYVIGPDFETRSSNRLGDFETNVTSLYVDWYPVCVESWIQPYIGVGVNYTDIDQDYLRPVFVEDVVNSNGVVTERIDRGLVNFGSSWGWTAQVGVDIEFGRNANWLVNASAMYINADPEIEVGVDNVVLSNGIVVDSVRYKDDLDYDSWIFNLGVGYKFSF
ncbi:OmpW/AlkL family protein [Microbulbifer hydrolyticus]|uniref:Outer membrane beta-barrel protein n=1 Tax=Microbulbifer hydrolyticus TaxID=48074 RepID=A0A6P1TCQ1_9GAMM|nr:OmpW family outer membrane protein [Microbulbifer hydrolyticus]MBB5210044.1 outer membrane protein W [Microbulbifer hydrolyticus]QHQ39433.1 outer membrane beta-barrel protein [Microbulbifer hydrolyticus]